MKQQHPDREPGRDVLRTNVTDWSAEDLWQAYIQLTEAEAGGLGDEPRRIFEELGKIILVDVVLPTRNGPEIRRRCVRRPTDHQAILLERLGLVLPRQITS